MKEEKKNSAVELWRYIFTIAIAIGHLNAIVWSKGNVDLLFTGYKFLAFFMFLSGYFLMVHYQKNKRTLKKEEASVSAWQYTKKRISALYPALFGGVLFAFIVRNVIAETSMNEIFSVFMNSLFEFLGISQLGMNTMTLWNEPLWYISALFIVGYILYYLVSKNEDIFRVIAVIFLVIVYGGLGLYGSVTDAPLSILGIPSNIIRLMAGMCAGMVMYYIVNYFQKKKFNENITMIFSVLHIGLAVTILYIWLHGPNINASIYDLLLFIFTTILLVNKDYISVLYNDSEVLNCLGRLSLYYFACHIGFIYLLANLFPEMTYVPSIIFNIVFSTCWAFIMLYFDEYVITPIFRERKTARNPRLKK